MNRADLIPQADVSRISTPVMRTAAIAFVVAFAALPNILTFGQREFGRSRGREDIDAMSVVRQLELESVCNAAVLGGLVALAVGCMASSPPLRVLGAPSRFPLIQSLRLILVCTAAGSVGAALGQLALARLQPFGQSDLRVAALGQALYWVPLGIAASIDARPRLNSVVVAVFGGLVMVSAAVLLASFAIPSWLVETSLFPPAGWSRAPVGGLSLAVMWWRSASAAKFERQLAARK